MKKNALHNLKWEVNFISLLNFRSSKTWCCRVFTLSTKKIYDEIHVIAIIALYSRNNGC